MTKSGDSKSSVYYGFHSLLDLTTPLHIIAELSLSDEPARRRRNGIRPIFFFQFVGAEERSFGPTGLVDVGVYRSSFNGGGERQKRIRGGHIWCQLAPVAIYEDDYEHEKAGSIDDDRYE